MKLLLCVLSIFALALPPPTRAQAGADGACTGENYDHAHESYSSYDACACDGSNCECVNDDSTTDTSGTECGNYWGESCSGWDDGDFTAADQCCHCTGGGTRAYMVPDFLDHGATNGWCYSEWNDCYDMADEGVSTNGGAWSFCAQKADTQGKTLVAVDVGEATDSTDVLMCCQDECTCMDEGHGDGYEVITLDVITNLPTGIMEDSVCVVAPTPAPTATPAGTQDNMAAVFTAANPSWTTCLTESGGTPTNPCASSLITCDGNDVTEISFQGGILGSCSLTGSIPKELGAITTLTKLLLYYNDLRGTVPKELGDLTALTYFDLDYNEGLWGNLPLAFATQSWDANGFQVVDGTNFNVAPCVEGETTGSTVAEQNDGVMCFLDAQRVGQTGPGQCTGENSADAGGMTSSTDTCACDGSDCACVNDDTTTDSWGYKCGEYSTTACSGYDDDDFTAATQCCHCKMYVDDDAAGKVGMAAIIAGTAILLLMA